MDKKKYRAGRTDGGMRLDLFLAGAIPELSRSAVQKICRRGLVLVDGETVYRPSFRLRENQEIELYIPAPAEPAPRPENIPLDIAYEDRDLLVINKAKGMVVHPAAGHRQGTLVNALLAHCQVLPAPLQTDRPGIVHRLDKDTSGLLVAAKSELAFHSLTRQFKDRKVLREYLAVVHGLPPAARGTVDAPLGRNPRNRKKFAVVGADCGREAITHYRLLSQSGSFSVLILRLETGRTHQVRVHLAYLGCPVAGDPLYGPRHSPYREKGQLLHACRLGFTHPRSGKYLEFTALPGQEFRPFMTGGWEEDGSI